MVTKNQLALTKGAGQDSPTNSSDSRPLTRKSAVTALLLCAALTACTVQPADDQPQSNLNNQVGGAGGSSSSGGAGGSLSSGGIESMGGTGGTGAIGGTGATGGTVATGGSTASGGTGGSSSSGGTSGVTPKSIDVLAIGEYDQNHAPFVEACTAWLETETNLTVTHIENPNSLTDELLGNYGLIFQMNYVPYSWSETAKAAFEKYVTEGKGGWVGLHHAGLYGPVVTSDTWPWFYDFFGQANFKGYIAEFAAADVYIEASNHPIFAGVPSPFNVTTDEWYTWDKSPRPNVTVLANVNEDSYVPDSPFKMGDHPVVWTNESYAAKNVYIFMGHHPNLFENEAYVTLLRNALNWAGTPSE